jgi:DNA polymerase III alpha subunit
MKFQDLLTKLKNFKNDYNTKDLSIDVRGLATLLMAGAMDSLFDAPLTVHQRKEAIEELKKAMKSVSTLTSSKSDDISLAHIDNELTRNLWLSKNNPLHRFSLSGFYSSALCSMGFQPCSEKGVSFTSEQADIMNSFTDMFEERLLSLYSNPNYSRDCAIVAIYKNKEVMTCKNGSKRMSLTFFDGVSEMTVTAWSNRRTKEFDSNLLMRIKEKNVPLLIFGRPGKYMGRNQFTLDLVLELGF